MNSKARQFSFPLAESRTRTPAINIACATNLLLLLLLTLPAAVQAQFKYTTNNGAITITGYTGSGGAVTIPDTITGMPVTSLARSAFSSLKSLTSVTVPDGVTNIASDVFYMCTSLTRVTLGSSLTNIGQFALYYCTSLTGIYCKGNAFSLGTSVLEGDNKATVYYLPNTTGWGTTFGGRPAVLWNPQVSTSDARFGVRTNRFGFTITGTTNIPIVVEASTNLANPLWSPLQSCTLTNGSLYFSDANWTNYPGRFYRIRSP